MMIVEERSLTIQQTTVATNAVVYSFIEKHPTLACVLGTDIF